jgi:hypothetical protein
MRLLSTLAVLCGLFATNALCQTPHESAPRNWKLGGELDALSYATKGYYGSFFAGRDGWRVRAIVSRVNPPGFANPEGFDRQVNAYVLAADRFFGPRRRTLEGFWIGPGVELWRNRVQREGTGDRAHFNNLVPTVGVGYVWKVSKHVYLNPWAAAHIVAGGARRIPVGDGTYEQKRLHVEASMKVGFVF